MKNLIYLLCLLPVLVWAQNNDQNYIKVTTYRDSTTATTARIDVTYFDGLGRPIQQVAGKMSNSGKDMITHIEYDGLGRQPKEYLPYPSSSADLSFDGSAVTNVSTYYSTTSSTSPNLYPQETTTNPYSEKFFEPSPLSRVLKQGAPGAAWLGNADPYNNSDHTVKFGYQTNAANEVRKFSVTATTSNGIYGTLALNGTSSYYDANTLSKAVTKNENWTSGVANTTEEFKNKEGQVVLKKTYNGSTAHETYYIYDQFGNLTYVLPPLCNGSATNINTLGYQYKYDSRNRLAEKKLPGKQWEYIVYDKLDRPILSGPVTTPFGGSAATANDVGWIMTIYDAFGRVAMTGWFSETISSATRNSRQGSATFGAGVVTAIRGSSTVDGISVGYNAITSLPSTFKLLTINYYDDYTWPGAPTVPASSQVEGQNIRSKANGLPTGSWVRVLTTASETYRQLSYTLYDRRARAVRSYTSNYLGGYTQQDSKLDFDGSVLYTKTTHKRIASSTEITIREDFIYNAQDRLTYHTHSINTAIGQTLANNTYNELGQLITKKVGNYAPTTSSLPTTVMQTIDYKYNVRGWLTDINDVNSLGTDLFAFRIAYNSVTDQSNGALSIPAQYNGNISETYWRSGDNILRKYSYKYDNLNRLTNAYYQKPGADVPNPGSYNESVRYDMNGNITSLLRTGGLDDPTTQVQIDDLTYTYTANTNQIVKIDDNSGSPQGFKDAGVIGNIEYTYDANGNMLRDYNKGITSDIKYNHLNLPTEIAFGSNKIVYLYDASGKKLKKTVTENGTTVYVDYLDGFQYKGGVLQFFSTAEGYVDNTVNSSGTNVYNYVYQYKDHLGNVRVSFATVAGKNGAQSVGIKEQHHYYPFGLKHLNYNVDYLEYQEIEGEIELYPSLFNTPKNNYKYNGKELQDELGLNLYDYGARNYDPALGRWMNIDPLAEKYRRWSPYNYCMNNPLRFIDPDGMGVLDHFINAKTGEYLGSDSSATNNFRVIYKKDWDEVTNNGHDSKSTAATSELQNRSGAITIDSSQIQSDMDTINTETINDQSHERQMYLGLNVDESGDYPSAVLTSAIGPSGENAVSYPDIGDGRDANGKTTRFMGTQLRPVAQAHTHNKAAAGKTNVPKTSDDSDAPKGQNDFSFATGNGITIYAIDSWTGNTPGGNAIHSVNSRGQARTNIGTTTSNNIGQDALNQLVSP